MDPEPDRRAEALIPDLVEALGSVAVGDCPPDDLLVGLAEQRLPERVAEKIRAHLVRCDACREVVALLADEPFVVEDGPLDPTGRSFPFVRVVLVLAACLALGVGLALWRQADVGPVSPGTDERLVAAAQVLARTAPALFSDFRVLGERERQAPYDGARVRGGLRLVMPRGRLLDPRPTFRWHGVAGADTYHLSVLDAQGAEVWTRTGAHTDRSYPLDREALERGARYVWKVQTRGVMGPVDGRASFEIADAEAVRRFEEARTRIVETVDEDLAPLLEAHFALRHGFLVHAWQVLGAEGVDGSDDPVVQATRRYVARRLDLALEADD